MHAISGAFLHVRGSLPNCFAGSLEAPPGAPSCSAALVPALTPMQDYSEHARGPEQPLDHAPAAGLIGERAEVISSSLREQSSSLKRHHDAEGAPSVARDGAFPYDAPVALAPRDAGLPLEESQFAPQAQPGTAEWLPPPSKRARQSPLPAPAPVPAPRSPQRHHVDFPGAAAAAGSGSSDVPWSDGCLPPSAPEGPPQSHRASPRYAASSLLTCSGGSGEESPELRFRDPDEDSAGERRHCSDPPMDEPHTRGAAVPPPHAESQSPPEAAGGPGDGPSAVQYFQPRCDLTPSDTSGEGDGDGAARVRLSLGAAQLEPWALRTFVPPPSVLSPWMPGVGGIFPKRIRSKDTRRPTQEIRIPPPLIDYGNGSVSAPREPPPRTASAGAGSGAGAVLTLRQLLRAGAFVGRSVEYRSRSGTVLLTGVVTSDGRIRRVPVPFPSQSHGARRIELIHLFFA